MSSVTVTGFKDENDAGAGSVSATATQRKGNIGSFKHRKTVTPGLVAKDTMGNDFNVPDYSIKDILGAIPKECYQRRWYEGMYFVFRDIACCAAMMYTAATVIPMVPNTFARGVLWVLYAMALSLPYTGIWVMAHECGHQAFSDYGWLNDTVGWILHSYLLVPYFSWKYSHGKHHKATGHIVRDMVFVPPTKEKFKERREALHLSDIAVDTPVMTLWSLIVQQLGGWWWYLLTNVTAGQEYPDHSTFAVSHFNPNSPIFEKRDYWFIWLSDLGIAVQLFVVYNMVQYFGGFNTFIHWFLPYVFCNHWLVFITFLQHTDLTLPHYEDREWNFARGAAATIDRNFGFIGWFFFHDIIETHVLHHYVSRIPFYNARIGTEAVKKVMGEHYLHDEGSMWKALWRAGRMCEFVDGDNGVLMFRNHNGFGIKPEDD